jgi:hypothetical protein
VTRNPRIAALSGRDPYQLLGVRRDSPLEEIRRSYRRLMIEAHPDRGGDAALAALLNCALLVLERDRDAYDTTHPTARAEAADPWDDLPPDEPDEDDDPWTGAEAGFRAEPPPPPQPQPAPEPVVPVAVRKQGRPLSPWASLPAVLLYIVAGLLLFALLTVLAGGSTQPRALPDGIVRFTPAAAITITDGPAARGPSRPGGPPQPPSRTTFQDTGGTSICNRPSCSSAAGFGLGSTEVASPAVADQVWSGLARVVAASSRSPGIDRTSTASSAGSVVERLTANRVTAPDSSSRVATASTSAASPYFAVS